MNLQCFSIYDQAADAYLPPFFLQSVALANRAIAMAVSDPQTEFSKFPHQYQLFHVGVFNVLSGELVSLPKIQNLGTLGMVAKRVQEDKDNSAPSNVEVR